jgi:hypothetical protein
MAYTQAQVNAALAAELAARPQTSQADLNAYAKATYGLTDAQLNAAYDTIPGFNAKGQYDAADYIATTQPGQVSPQMVVDAANAANPYSAQNMARVDTTRQGQYVQDASGRPVALTSYSPGFDINNPTALMALGSLRDMGGTDSTSQAFNAIATPAQKAEADRLWSVEKARLEAIDRQAALLTPTGQTTQTAQTQATKTYTPAQTALYNAFKSGDIAGANNAIQSGKLTAAQIKSDFGLTDADMSYLASSSGVKFYTPPAAVTTNLAGDTTGGIFSGVRGAINSGIGQTRTYTDAETALFNAYRSGNIAEFNRLTAANKFTAGDMQSKFGLTDADMNWITNNAGGKFYSEGGTGPGGVPGGVPGGNTGGLGGLGGLGTFGQNFQNYTSIPIGAQYNPNVVGGTGSPYAQVMGQMQPFQNPYAGLPVNQPMGGYDPGLYDRIIAANAAKAAAAVKGGNVVEVGGVSGDTGVSQESINDSVAAANAAAAVTGESVSVSGETGESVSGIYNKGGIVDGLFGPNPPGPDDGAGLLDRGEYVIKKSSVNKYGRGLLDMINEGKVPAKKMKSLLG